MVTKLVSNDNNNNSFKLPVHYIFVEDTKYMTILTRQERERLVIELYYNQGKTYREISKEVKISPHDIEIILNKEVQEKSKASKGEQQDNAEQNQQEEGEQKLSLFTQVYKLFSDRNTPLEVAVH